MTTQIRHRIGGYAHGHVPAPIRAEQLLDVAEQLFSTRGFGATSVEAIARAAKVTRPMVYKRFGSKDAIYLACLRRAREELEAMLFESVAAAGADLHAQFVAGADAYFRFVEQGPQRWRVLFGGGAAVSGDVAETAMELHLRTERRFAQLFRQAAPDANEHQLVAYAHAVGGAAHQLAQWWLRTPRISRREIVALYCTVTWDGLAAALGVAQTGD
jgi:AcrR family transcriptional regulator